MSVGEDELYKGSMAYNTLMKIINIKIIKFKQVFKEFKGNNMFLGVSNHRD